MKLTDSTYRVEHPRVIREWDNLQEKWKQEENKAYKIAGILKRDWQQKFINAKIAEILLKEGNYDQARRAIKEYIELLIVDNTLRSKVYWIIKLAESFKKEFLKYAGLFYYNTILYSPHPFWIL